MPIPDVTPSVATGFMPFIPREIFQNGTRNFSEPPFFVTRLAYLLRNTYPFIMFDFLAEDDVEALTADLAQHGCYLSSTINHLRSNLLELDQLLSAKGLPSIAKGKQVKTNKKQELTPEQIDGLLGSVNVSSQKVQSEPNNPDGPVGKEQGKLATTLDKQRTALSYILDYHDKRPIRLKLKDINVTTHEYQEWLQQENFQRVLRKELDLRFKNLDIDAKLGLSRLILEGDLNAIKYYYEFTGLYRPQTETQVNLTVIIAKLMDVLVRHVNPESLDTIASEIERDVFQSLSAGD